MNQITYIYIFIKNTSEVQFDIIALIIFAILVNKISLMMTTSINKLNIYSRL